MNTKELKKEINKLENTLNYKKDLLFFLEKKEELKNNSFELKNLNKDFMSNCIHSDSKNIYFIM